jgi:hypothetical protein
MAASWRAILVIADSSPRYRLTQRDLRIDFFRGLSLYMVLVDHIPWDPISKVTYRAFGFSDAAEIFFFLSGVSCGITYSRVLTRNGWLGLMTTIMKRATKIYFYYLLCSFAVIVFAIAAADPMASEVWPSLHSIQKDPVTAVQTTIELASPTPHSYILAIYVLLTLIVIPLFLAGAKYSAELTLGFSGLIWIICQLDPHLMLDYFNPILTPYWTEYFNPLAWQFLLSIGMFIGIKYDSPPPLLVTIQRSGWVLVAGWAIVITSFLAKHPSYSSLYLHVDLGCLQISNHTLAKSNLTVVRLLHFLSVALLVATYLKASNPIFLWISAVPFTAAGKRSLELYSLSVALSTLIGILVGSQSVSFVGQIGLDCIAIVLMALTAIALTRPTNGNPRQYTKSWISAQGIEQERG